MSTPALVIDLSGLEEAARDLRKEYQPIAGKVVASLMGDMGNTVRRHVRASASRHRVSGRLVSNVRVFKRGQGFDRIVQVASAGSVATLVTQGARSHIIARERVMPMREGHGAWRRGSGAGIIGFRRSVSHPGFAGDPYFQRGVGEAEGEINELMQIAIGTIADLLAAQLEGD